MITSVGGRVNESVGYTEKRGIFNDFQNHMAEIAEASYT